MKNIILVLIVGFSLSTFAADLGFIYQGKQYIVYKDGKKIGKDLDELFPEAKTSPKREPAGISADTSNYYVMIDGPVRCYRAYTSNAPLSCVYVPK
jgi:hypothetical protein